MREKNAYIFGTDADELYRLGVQHQVWASEAQKSWELAGFKAGQTLLDLGCGPGFCTKELAFIAGHSGKVIGVDKSAHFIDFLNGLRKRYQLNIETVQANFDAMHLEQNSLDGAFCRWALAWIPNPKDILLKVRDALKPGGRIVLHEYYDWTTHQTEPKLPALSKAISVCLQSLRDQAGEIDIGRYLPRIFDEIGMKVIGIRVMAKLAKPDELTWQWPKTFYYNYLPKLVEMGYLTNEEVKAALADLDRIEKLPGSTLCCPLMVEVIAER